MQRTKINRKEIKNVECFGVEIECFNVNRQMLIAALQLKGIDCRIERYNHQTRTWWKIVDDASVRDNQGRNYNDPDNNGCMELVSPILKGMEGLKALREVCLALYFCGAKVNKSCGLHIHHNTRHIGLDEQQKVNLLNFYARCENTIDAFTPESRKRSNNSMCQSMVSAFGQARVSGLEYLGRYHKLNFNSLHRHGSLEFRQHAGTIEFEKMYHWIVFTANFLHNCKDKRSQSRMNYIERAWVPKHLKLEKRTWDYFKGRMKQLQDAQDLDRRNVIQDEYRLSA